MSTVQFNRNLYAAGAIRAAIKQFKDFGTFQIKSDRKNYNVKIQGKNLAENQDRLTDEFRNYVLYMVITNAANQRS
jgi:hypothetical protein